MGVLIICIQFHCASKLAMNMADSPAILTQGGAVIFTNSKMYEILLFKETYIYNNLIIYTLSLIT